MNTAALARVADNGFAGGQERHADAHSGSTCRSDGTRAVLLGVGNILLNDEGVGVRAVERYVASHTLADGVVALDGGTSAMEMLEDLENLDLLVVVDCVRVGQPPATVVVLTGDEVPAFFRQRLSPHQVGLSDVFATLLLTGRAPRELVVIGVQPVDIGVDMRLTPAVEACVPRVLDEIHTVLAQHGYASPRGPVDAVAMTIAAASVAAASAAVSVVPVAASAAVASVAAAGAGAHAGAYR